MNFAVTRVDCRKFTLVPVIEDDIHEAVTQCKCLHIVIAIALLTTKVKRNRKTISELITSLLVKHLSGNYLTRTHRYRSSRVTSASNYARKITQYWTAFTSSSALVVWYVTRAYHSILGSLNSIYDYLTFYR